MIVRTRSGIAAYAIAFAALALLTVRSWRIDYDYSIDFQTYWLAGARVLHGEAAKLYEPGGGPADGTPVAMGANEFKNIPLVAAGFAPLAAWDYATAKRIVWWGGLLAILASGWLCGRFLLPESVGPPSVRVAFSLAALAAMTPAHVSLRHGQTTAFMTLLLASCLALLVRERPAGAGIALGAACLVKFPPLALLGVLAVRARWRAVAACVATILGGVLLSVVCFGPALHRAYGHGIAEQAGKVMAGHNNQSIAALTTRVLDGASNQDWTPRDLSPAAAIATRAIALALGALLAWTLVSTRGELAADAAGALAFGIVVLPVAWDHYLLMAAPALVALTGRLYASELPSRTALLVSVSAAYVLMALPTPHAWIEAERSAGTWDALRLSHGCLGAIALALVAMAAARKAAAA